MLKWIERWRERKRNQKKKYTLSFRKTNKSYKLYEYKEICDWVIIDVIENLSVKYDVQILKMDIRDCISKSCIEIFCTEDMKNKFVYSFTKLLGGWIGNINI